MQLSEAVDAVMSCLVSVLRLTMMLAFAAPRKLFVFGPFR